ncbi:BatD family protein [Vibrio sp. SCSIO 43155]|uniref:BatD family protein n=1 Tax=Vibrio sp. SCSIO 43155 TaxID=2819099 RepID=UPI002075928F|nr:BatD family protein [Vibrio sp. SCSIO 43155]ELI6425724.1 BatD family protein [Vibrio harveyi]USD58111.1 BatD family protein [Vibrio sp. SCSIO 43155]
MMNVFKLGADSIVARLSTILMVFTLFFTGLANAQDIQDLQRSDNVELLAWVGKQGAGADTKEAPKFSVNEQVILYIEVATPRWFTGGTRIGSVEIPNVIAKQRNQLATNYTERKGGKTWSRQRWEITLYPQASGQFVIPPVAVGVQVSAPDGSKVAGTLYTQPIKFEASMPSGLLSDESEWFTATKVSVGQKWTTSNDELKVGDAITRTITINAQDSLSVLLPDLLSNDSTASYQAYPQPNRLDDKQTRGDYQSSRIEESVYVIQQGGEFTLPEHTFQWWNSQSKQLETVVIEGKTFKAKHTFKSFVRAYSGWLIGCAVTLFVLVIAVLSIHRYYRSRPTPPWLVFRRMVKANRWGDVRASLYKQLRNNTGGLEMSKASDSDVWQKRSQRLQEGQEDASLMNALWKGIQALKPKRFKWAIPKALPQLDKQASNKK